MPQTTRDHVAAGEGALPEWERFDAYLFDIDGTLLNCRDAVHYFAFCEALSWAAGRPVDLGGVRTHGSTDVLILRDALQQAGVDEASWRPHLPEMQRRMCDAVLRSEAALDPEVLPGVGEVLERLHARSAVLGVATGNLEPIGWAKLRRAGLRRFFRFGGFSTDAPTRPEIFAVAATHARALRGSAARICVVGDTPADIIAAQANGLAVIAAATGIYPAAELAEHGPTWCVGSLLDLLPGAQHTFPESKAESSHEQKRG